MISGSTWLCAWVTAGFLGWTSGALAESESLEPGDFATGRILEARGPGVVQSVLLDYDVYRRSVEPGLADLRVFEEDGRPAPYAIRRHVPAAQSKSRIEEIPIFSLARATGDSDPRGAGDALGNDFRIDAKLSDSGAVLSVYRGSVGDTPDDGKAGWLLDTSHLKRSIVGLEFTMGEEGGDFLSRMRLDASNDLASFSTVDADIALARLVQNGHQIERTDFEIPATNARYLRITPMDEAPNAELLRVRARLAQTKAHRRRMRHTIEGRFDPNESGIVLYDLNATLPIESVQVLLAEPNTLVEGQLEAAETPEGPWRVRQSGIFYFFEKGGALRNVSAALRSSSARHLRLVTSSRGGGLLDAPPSLEVVWRPEQLLYVQRGPGNSLLAVGRAGVEDGSFSPRDLLRMAEQGGSDFLDPTASLGPETELAGDSVLERKSSPPWRTYGLWGILLVSVGIVLILSWRLIRPIGPGVPPSTPT
jgi:hypothetical protein